MNFAPLQVIKPYLVSVPNAQVPQLTKYLDATSKYHHWLSLLVLMPLVLALSSASWAPSTLAWTAVSSYVCGIFVLFAMSRFLPGQRQIHGLVLHSLVHISFLMFFPLVTGLPLHPTVSFVMGLPWLAALVVPVRLSKILMFCLYSNACYILSVYLLPHPFQHDYGFWIQTAIVHTAAGLLAAHFQRLLWRDLAWRSKQRSSADRLSQLSQRTAGLAHEIKTPLFVTQQQFSIAQDLYQELAESLEHPDVTREDLLQIMEEMAEALEASEQSARRTHAFVQSVRHHHQRDQPSVQPIHLQSNLQMSLQDFKARAETMEVDLKLHAPLSPAWIQGDPLRLEQIIKNLVQNALDAIETSQTGSTIHVVLEFDAPWWVVRVRDNGPGIPENIHKRIFEPMFSTRGRDNGTGLGLSVCRDIARGLFQGELKLEPKTQGSCFAFFIKPHRRDNLTETAMQ